MTSSADMIAEFQVMYLIGVLERLSTLGFLAAPPYNISQEGIDTFIQLDENRYNLYTDSSQVKELLRVLLKSENGVDDPELLDNMFSLVKDYIYNRELIVKFGLSQQFA
jgi:hypothetical protein